jgi:energy-coupling factor transport system substrate-specific component
MRRGDFLSLLILSLASGLGLWGFLHPLFVSAQDWKPNDAQGQDAPFMMLGLLALCLLVVVANLETRRMDARVVALLGVLVGLNACLRVVSGPMGSSAVFFLPILCGYVFGADFGFLLATLSVLTSALLTGGVGPWLPFQMFATGWCGMLSGWLPRLQWVSVRRRGTAVAVMLASWGAASGFLVGMILNLWFWPYIVGNTPRQAFEPGLGLGPLLWRYFVFYLATSSWWDAGRAVGNALLLLAAGPAVLRLLDRSAPRFRFRLEGEGQPEDVP